VKSPPVTTEPVQLRFKFMNYDTQEVLTDYEEYYEKKMHLIVISEDLQEFQHIHPEMSADGTFLATMNLQRPTKYKVFTDGKSKSVGWINEWAGIAMRTPEVVAKHTDKTKPLPVIKIILDDPDLLKRIEQETAAWSRNFDITFWDSVPDAFLSFSTKMPDVLIVQTSKPLNEQVSTVIALDKFLKKSEKEFSVLVLSQYFELKAEVQLSIHESIQIFNKYLNSELLNVFMSGAYAMTFCNSMKNTRH
jgi:hypothetical protein